MVGRLLYKSENIYFTFLFCTQKSDHAIESENMLVLQNTWYVKSDGKDLSFKFAVSPMSQFYPSYN